MKEIDIISAFENALWRYWESRPEPKKRYTTWYYGEGGVRDSIENWQVPKSGTEEDK